MGRLKKAAYGLVGEIDGLRAVAVEGGGAPAEAWLKEGRRRELAVLHLEAPTWRERLMLPRHRRSGKEAKERADALARRVIEWSGAERPTSLRHDAAEAILVGLWAVLAVGWLDELPEALR